MVEKYFGGTLPAEKQSGAEDAALIDMANALKAKVETSMDSLQLPTALSDIFQFVSRSNKYIDETTPWILAKDEANNPRLAGVLYNLLESIRVVSVLLQPFMPHSTPEFFRQIGANDQSLRDWESAAVFGKLPADITVQKGEVLFPRIDLKKELEELDALREAAIAKAAPAPEKAEGVVSMVNISEFGKIELKVAKVTACEPVPKSDKLLRLELDDGSGETRQVVSGIHMWYKPDDLTGRKIIIVANLKPAKLRGVESNGMILAADIGEDARVIFVDDDIPCGSVVR